jgi:hypothetical protein
MSDKKKDVSDKSIYDQLNNAGHITGVIDAFAHATEDEMTPEAREYIENNVRNISERLDKMMGIFREIANDPEKRKVFEQEMAKQTSEANATPKPKEEK